MMRLSAVAAAVVLTTILVPPTVVVVAFAPVAVTTIRGGSSTTSSSSTLSAADTTTATATDEYVVGILGDLHIDPRKMEDYAIGKAHFESIFNQAKSDGKGVAIVSLGDLGESKNCGHNPESDSELFAGTTLCHEMAADFLGSFGVPYEVVGGNHDLEGLVCSLICRHVLWYEHCWGATQW